MLCRKIDTGIKMNNKQTNIKGVFVSFTIIYMMPITIRAVTSDLITACFVINMTKKFPTYRPFKVGSKRKEPYSLIDFIPQSKSSPEKGSTKEQRNISTKPKIHFQLFRIIFFMSKPFFAFHFFIIVSCLQKNVCISCIVPHDCTRYFNCK